MMNMAFHSKKVINHLLQFVTKQRKLYHIHRYSVTSYSLLKSHKRSICGTALNSNKGLRIRKHSVQHQQDFSSFHGSPADIFSESDLLDVKDPCLQETLSHSMIVKTDFVTEEEEKSLLDEVDKYMRRLRYEFDHWDNAIHGYRETEKKTWSDHNSEILERVRGLAFTSAVAPLAYVHVLDIAKEGYIKPHVDAVRFCGDTIAGICLLSPCVMRLAQESDCAKYADVYLPRRCLYIMRGKARYEFTHEVLKDEESYFKGQHVPRDRRISVICRNEPSSTLD